MCDNEVLCLFYREKVDFSFRYLQSLSPSAAAGNAGNQHHHKCMLQTTSLVLIYIHTHVYLYTYVYKYVMYVNTYIYIYVFIRYTTYSTLMSHALATDSPPCELVGYSLLHLELGSLESLVLTA